MSFKPNLENATFSVCGLDFCNYVFPMSAASLYDIGRLSSIKKYSNASGLSLLFLTIGFSSVTSMVHNVSLRVNQLRKVLHIVTRFSHRNMKSGELTGPCIEGVTLRILFKQWNPPVISQTIQYRDHYYLLTHTV